MQAQQYESMLFNYETCNKTDFRYGEIKPSVKTVYKPKLKREKKLPMILKDVHTISEWKNKVPFDLLIPLKEIVRTNPHHIQEPYSKPPDLEREEIQKTRPRLVMTPAVSMDDVSSNDVRDILVKDVYTSVTMEALQESAAAVKSKPLQAPFPGRPAPANPITLKKLQPPYVSPEWRMESVSWDGRQLRAKCDPDKEFYLARLTPKCDACDVSAYLESQKKLAKLMK